MPSVDNNSQLSSVMNSAVTQDAPKQTFGAGSLTRASNDSNATLKSTNAEAIATTPDDLAAAVKRAMSKTKPETTATNQSEVGKEYRAKRFNVQTPSIDKSQVDTLVSMVKKLKELKGNNALSTHESPKFYALVSKLETLSETIATHNNNGDFKNWIQADIPKKKDGAVSKVLKRAVGVSTQTKEGEVGSRQKAQSLTRRLEATLQGLLGVSRALMSITEHPSTEVIKQVVDQGMDEVEDDPQSAAYKRLREERIAATQDKLAQECAEALNSAEHEITKTKQRHSQRKHFSHEGAESFFKQASQVFKNALPHLSNRQPVSDKQRFHLMELRLQHEVEKLKENANEQTSTKLLVTAAEKLLKSTISQSIVWDGKVDESKSLINRELKGYLTGTLSTLCSVAEQLNSFAEYPDDAALTRKAEAQIRQNIQELSSGEKETLEGLAWQTELDNKVSTLKSANQWKLNQTRKAVSRQIEVLAHIKAPKSKEFYSDILGSLVQIENQLPKESDRSVVSKVKDTWVSTKEDASKGISQLEQKFPATLNAAQAKLTSIIGASQKDRQTLQEKVLDSAVRTVLESLQRPAIKLQEPSQSLHTLVKELKGVEGELKYHEAHTSSHGSETNKQADDLIKQESPKALKLAALSQLLDKRTQSARDAITRQLPNDLPSAFNRDNLESHQAELTQIMQDKLWTQVSTAIHSLLKQESVEEKHHERIQKQLDDAYKTSFKTVADELVKSMIDLQKSVQAAEKRSFSDADHFSSLSSARTQKMTASLANQSATIKGRPTLDNKSVGAFLARHWAEQIQSELKLSPEDPLPEEGKVHTLLKEQGVLDESILSRGDPKGFLMASRVVQELDNARRGELVHPMSPQESAEMEKGLIDFMVSWGQKRLSRGAPELIIEAVTDLPTACTFNIFSPLYRVPIAAIKVPYSVHKTSSLNRPEQDKPYKAINVVLEKKLKQLGFQIITSPLPTVAKVGLGGALAVGGMAYNAKVKEQESSLDSIHGRHVNGDKSKQLKIDSYASMAGRLVFGAPGVVSEEISDAIKTRLAGNLNGIQERGVTATDVDDKVAKLERYPGEVKTWQYEGAEGLSITIEGTEEYYHHVSSVLDELAYTEMGEKLQQALEGKPFSIHFPKEVGRDGISVHPASIDPDNNIIYFDPLNTLSHDSESGGGDQPMLTLAHELIHRLDKDNLRRDDDAQPFTAEEKSLLEAMAVGATYKSPDGQEVDFRDPEVKKKYLKKGAPIFTVNQLRDELGIEERLEYTEGDNSAEGRLHFQHPGNSNLRTEVSLYRSRKLLEKQIEETETKKDENPNWRLFKEGKLKSKLKRLNAQLNVVNNQIARFQSEAPNIERLAFAKLWLAEAKAGSFEKNMAAQYLESVESDIDSDRGVQSEQVNAYGTQVLALDDFKRETMAGLEDAYTSGDRVKVYTFVLSKLASVKEKLANGEVKTLEQVQTLLAQKQLLEQAEEKLLNEAYMSNLPEVRHLFGVENDNAVAPESGAVEDASERLTTLTERYQELGREVEEYSGITESQFSRNPDDPRYVEARDRLEGIVSDLSDDYWAITGKRPELPDHGEGYAGLQSLIDTADDLMAKLRTVERLSVQLTEEVDGDISAFFQDKRSNLSIVNYRDVFVNLRENYNNEIRALEQSEETIINGVPKETLIQRVNAKLLLVDQREREYIDKFRPHFSEQGVSSEEDMKQEGEFQHAFACLEKAKSNGFFIVDGRPIPTSDLASMTIFVSSPKYNVDPTPITLLEYLTSQDDYSDFYLIFPREVSDAEKVYLEEMRGDIASTAEKLNKEPIDYRFLAFDSKVKNLDVYLQQVLDDINQKHGTNLTLDDKVRYSCRLSSSTNTVAPSGGTFADTGTVRELLLGELEKKLAMQNKFGVTVTGEEYRFVDARKGDQNVIDDLVAVDMQNDYINELKQVFDTSDAAKGNPNSLISNLNGHVGNILWDLGFDHSQDKVYELETSTRVYHRFGSGVMYTEMENGGEKANGLMLVELKSQTEGGKTPVVLISPITGQQFRFESMESFKAKADESEDQGDQRRDAQRSNNALTEWIHAHLPSQSSPKYAIELTEVNPSHVAENMLSVMQDRLVDIADREATSDGERRGLVALEMIKPLLILASVPLALANPAIAVPLGIVMGSGPAFAQAAIADSPEEKEGYIIEGLIGVGAEVGGQVAGQALKGILGKGAKAYRAFANNLDDAPTTSGSFRPNGGRAGGLDDNAAQVRVPNQAQGNQGTDFREASFSGRVQGNGEGHGLQAGNSQPIRQGGSSDHSSSVQPRRQNMEGQGFRGNTRRLEDWGGNGGQESSHSGRTGPRYRPIQRTTVRDVFDSRRTNPASVGQPRSHEARLSDTLYRRTGDDLASVRDARLGGSSTTTQPGVWQLGIVLARAAGL